MKLQTLYHEGKSGKLYSWDVYTISDVITTEYGTIDGKKTVTSKKIKGKNIGKANETTPKQQAENECQSMWQNKIDRKYSKTKKKAKETVYLPMLAGSFDKRKDKIKYPFDVQPKLDGIRCLINMRQLLSRSGKQFDIKHISDSVPKVENHIVLDGEIYIHGEGFQTITKLVKKYRPGKTEKLQFHIYDIFSLTEPTIIWSTRKEMLSKIEENDVIKKVHTVSCTSEEQLKGIERYYLDIGYEGVIVRLHEGMYELGHRSNNLLKVKRFKDEEYKIVDFTTGTGRAAEAIVWMCETKKEQRFTVVPIGTLESRIETYHKAKKGNDMKGKMLKVKYFEKTDAGLPRFPIGLGIRLKEDMHA